MTINCDWLPLTRSFPREAYIFHTRGTFLPCETQSAISHSFPFQSRCFLFIPVSDLYAHRDRESRPPEPDALHRDTCSGVQAIRFLGSVVRDCSLARSSSSTSADRDLPGGRSGLRLLCLRLLSSGRLWDYTVNIFLHRLRSTTSGNTLCRLVWMEPPVPSALVPPRCTILNDCFSFPVYLL